MPIHAREELGFDIGTLAKPVQASAVSALSFTVGALLPVLIVAIAPASSRLPLTVTATLIGLVILGLVGARLGGGRRLRAAIRVLIGGTLALSIALGIGRLTGSVV